MNKPDYNDETLEKAYNLYVEHAKAYSELESGLMSSENPMTKTLEVIEHNPDQKTIANYINILERYNETLEGIIIALNHMVHLVEGNSEHIDYEQKDDQIALRVYLVQTLKQDGIDFEDYFTNLKMKQQMYSTQKHDIHHMIERLQALVEKQA